MERKWVIVAFGDILGFGVWARRAANSQETKQTFIHDFYDAIEKFILKNDCYLKYLGDGIMLLKELPNTGHKSVQARCFLNKTSDLTRTLLRVVKTCEWPPPAGFRVRIVAGHVDKIVVTDPQDKKRRFAEYVGYPINLAQRLLEIRPRVLGICHESVLKVLGQKKKGIKFTRLGDIEERLRGVDPEDVAGLWSFKL